jgi:O-antigen/teichoic acid export membrane protein
VLKDSTFGRSAAILVAGRSVGFVCRFVMAVVLARQLAQVEFGVYKQAFLLQSTFIMLLDLGLPASLYYFLQHAEQARRQYVSQSLAVLALAAVAGGVAVVVGAPWWGQAFYDNLLGPLALHLAVFLASTLVSLVLEVVLIARQRAREAAVAYCVSDVALATLVLGTVLAGGGVVGILWAVTVVQVARTVALVLYLRRADLLSFRRLSWEPLTRQWDYAIPFWAGHIVELLAVAAPQYYVSSQYDTRTYAVFAVGSMTIPFVDVIYATMVSIVVVQLTRLAPVGARDQIRDTLGHGIRMVSVVCLPLFVLLELVAHEVIVLLYTHRFVDAVPVFRVSLLVLPLIATQLEYVPRAYGDTRFLFLMCAVRGGVCVALLTVLPPTFGLWGAPLAFVLALVASHVVLLVRVSRLTGLSYAQVWPLGVLGRIVAACLVAAIPLLLLKGTGLLALGLILAAAGVAFGAIYITMLWRLGVLSRGEKEAVRALGRRLGALGGVPGREAVEGRPR